MKIIKQNFYTAQKKFLSTMLSLLIHLILFIAIVTTDMLILHGREDEVAPWEQSVKFTIGHQNRKLVTIENEGHIFNFGNSWNICRREILDFVDNIKQ
ncbi:hypothetical protein [Photorhabdus heterorhabditis]|uniref:hypothetical protein n=1 Tax=Photorhabdus heterorhabditis TaxID=880156 RepID=UPI001BD2E0CC|nr:hypothetical protein [Photorhabdus heterorhabditis]MBS9443456.1 hypothetical protein [Photorhabdus heterorhabditis]